MIKKNRESAERKLSEARSLQPYSTVERDAVIENVEKRSRFTGRCLPVENEADALMALATIRKEHWNATHNCYAYRLRSGEARFSDDGEPAGTAGMPMIEALTKIGVTNVLVVVTRYFGGILLGAGGLVRAYSKAATDAVRASGIVRMLPCVCCRVVCAYPQWNSVRILCEKYGRIETTAFSENVGCDVWVRNEACESFLTAVREQTDGRVIPERIREACFPFPETEENQ